MSENPRTFGVVVESGKRTQAVEHQHAAHDLADAFDPFDRARLRMSEADRTSFRRGVRRAGVSDPALWHGTQPRHRMSDRHDHEASTTEERRTLTDHVTPHNQDDGLFRTAGQADEQQWASDVADVRPVTRPSRDLFPHAVNHEAAEHQRPATQRDEATMWSLRFPFDEDDCQ